MMTLTKKQYDTLLFIQEYTDTYHEPPLQIEIARHFGVSAPTMDERLKALRSRGYVEWEKQARRSIRVRRWPSVERAGRKEVA